MDSGGQLRLAIPSSGALYQPTVDMLQSCGLGIARTDSRRYTAEIPGLPGVAVIFQRGSDITQKIDEMSADIGIVGKDQFLESRREDGDTRVIIELGFGRSQLVLAVPDFWVDVDSISELARYSLELRGQGHDLKIATKYPRLVERHLLVNGVNYFSLVQSSGTLEAAPAMGFADAIADITESGTTLRSNRLKQIDGGTVIASQASLVSRRFDPQADQAQLERARSLTDMIQSHLAARGFYSITANIKGETAEGVAEYVLERADISGLRGPTISQVYTRESGGWFAVTVIVEQSRLLAAVDQLRSIGGTSVTVSQPNYVFSSSHTARQRLTMNGVGS